MLKGLIGEKIEMTQTHDSHGRVVPVTRILVRENYVVGLRTKEKEGYKAAQVGAKEWKKANKPITGIAKKAGLKFVPKVFREVDFDGELKLGQEISVDQVFRKGSMVDVVGVSKGKGFAGVVKRWGFKGGPRTHGQSDRERAPGSIGATTTPGRVYKGLKMAGHLGSDRVTVQGLLVMNVDKENREIWVTGSVPGARGTTVLIKKSRKKRKAYHEPEIPAMPTISGKEEVSEPENLAEKPEAESTEDNKPEEKVE